VLDQLYSRAVIKAWSRVAIAVEVSNRKVVRGAGTLGKADEASAVDVRTKEQR